MPSYAFHRDGIRGSFLSRTTRACPTPTTTITQFVSPPPHFYTFRGALKNVDIIGIIYLVFNYTRSS